MPAAKIESMNNSAITPNDGSARPDSGYVRSILRGRVGDLQPTMRLVGNASEGPGSPAFDVLPPK
jgi:hypothetical protein